MCLGVPGLILSIEGKDSISRKARVSFGGIVKEVNLAYTPEARVGEYVIVHVGFAISRIDGEEAAKVFEYLKEMDEIPSFPEPTTSSPAAAGGGPMQIDRPPTATLGGDVIKERQTVT